MDITISVLLAANILVPAIATYRACFSRGVEVNHVATFTFGYLFYWILPIAVGTYQVLSYNLAMRPFYDIFDQVSPSTLHTYLTISLCCYLFFVLGHVTSRRLRYRLIEQYANLDYDSRLLAVHLLLGVAACAVYAWLIRSQLFKGYTVTNDKFADPLRGTFAAWGNFLECVALIYTVNLQAKFRYIATFRRVLLNTYMLAALFALLLDMSLGQRHYLLTFAVMLVVYRSVFFERLQFRSALLLFAVGLGAAGTAALMRSTINFTLLEIICAEPLFTSLALVYFLREPRFPFIRFPYLLLRDLLAIVPTALMPNKFTLMPSVADAGVPLFNPLGTVHSFLSFLANFGVFGSFGVFFLLGFALNLIKSGTRVPLLRVIYIMLSAQLAFTLWRDDFSLSFVKNMLEFSILIPVMICVSSNVLSGLLRRKHLRLVGLFEEFAR